MLERAIALAVRAHAGQTDLLGMPYVLHPLRVMLRMDDLTAMTAAVLHDVLEDSDLELEDLRAHRFPEEVLSAVDALTRRSGEDYEEYIRRAGSHPLARRIKIADLTDNVTRTRLLPERPDRELRLLRYRRALEILSTAD